MGYSIKNSVKCRRCGRRLPIQLLTGGVCEKCRKETESARPGFNYSKYLKTSGY